ncbi:MAG: sigma-70 family RNA polymerase sigma factor [Chloroflexi bacterium]|nr:sigma-70 family RNA polymerase sigma factor [Chloroflexota bacterium]
MPPMTKRTNEQWLSDLHASGLRRETALVDLRAEILYGLPYALRDWLTPDDPHFAALVEEVAQETLMRALEHLDSFEGRSQFTTWVHKIAVRVALTELRRRRWKDVSLDGLLENTDGEPASPVPADRAPSPEVATEQADLLAQLQRLMMEELTAKQLRAMLAVGIGEMPLEEVARQMGMERNALYKLLHDARRRLKRRLAREGFTPAELLAVFERR